MDIRLIDITKSFDQKNIIQHLNLSFLERRINCLMGASGKGKTTIIHMIMGLLKPDSGEILGCKQKKISAVFQEDRLIEHWNAVKNIRLVCDRSVSEEQIWEELSNVGISRDQDMPVKLFSGGMRRRVAIVRAIMARHDILIMDEPFQGLDDALKQTLIEYVKHNTHGTTVIIVTHDKDEVERLETNLIML